MSEAEPIPPTSSVTALRIPQIKKYEINKFLSTLNKHHIALQLMIEEDQLAKLMKKAMEEIDIRWQDGSDNCKEKEVYIKTRRPIDLNPKNGSLLTKSKIEC
ncbi:hypothetical protein Tco_1360665 [Tanacetum coccineum]